MIEIVRGIPGVTPMRVPKTPPDWASSLTEDIAGTGEMVTRLLRGDVRQFVRSVNDKYLHWDKMRFQPLPEGLTPKTAWVAVGMSRQPQLQALPLGLSGNQKLKFWLPPQHQEWVSLIDKQAGGSIGGSEENFLAEDNERYL